MSQKVSCSFFVCLSELFLLAMTNDLYIRVTDAKTSANATPLAICYDTS